MIFKLANNVCRCKGEKDGCVCLVRDKCLRHIIIEHDKEAVNVVDMLCLSSNHSMPVGDLL